MNVISGMRVVGVTAVQSKWTPRDDIILDMVRIPETCVLVGPPGTGKTSLCNMEAQLLTAIVRDAIGAKMTAEDGRLLNTYAPKLDAATIDTNVSTYRDIVARVGYVPLYIFPANPGAQATDILGGYAPDDTGTWKFQPGVALHAWGQSALDAPGILVIDDAHNMSPEMMAAMYKAMDGGIGGMITLPNGKLIRPKSGYRFRATMNGEFADLDPAVQDRTVGVFQVMTPSEEMFSLLRADVQGIARADYDGTNPDPFATFRQWKALSDLWPRVGLGKAAMLTMREEQQARDLVTLLAGMGVQDAIDVLKATTNLIRSGYQP